MELNVILQILWRRKWIIFLTTLVTLAIVLVGKTFVPDSYTASSIIRFMTARGGSPENVRYEVIYADRLMNTYRRMTDSSDFQQELQEHLGQTELPKIAIGVLPNTELMRISAISPDPVMARETANKVADMLVAQSLLDSIYNFSTEIDGSPETAAAFQNPPVIVIGRAEIPTTPDGLSLPLYGLIGLISGLVTGSGLAFIVENTDDRLHDPEKIQDLINKPILAEISQYRKKRGMLILDSTVQAEEFRRLRTMLLSTIQPASHKTILVTSSDAKEGKSFIAANLAISLARMELKILLIDLDMRRPTQHQTFNLSGNNVGLSSVLTNKHTIDDAIHPTRYPELYVLPSGPLLANPADLIESRDMVSLLNKLKQQYDLILIDTPAFLHVPEVLSLSSLVNGLLVVIRRGHTRRKNLQTLLYQLSTQNAQLIGLVVNGSKNNGLSLHRGYYKHIYPQTQSINKKNNGSVPKNSPEKIKGNRHGNVR